MAITIASILNSWDNAGIFSYVLPFILIFALVFALLQKTAIFAKKKANADPVHNTTIEAIIAAAIGLLALQLDVVSIFFQNIFPKFGVGLAIFLVLIIFLGFFYIQSFPLFPAYRAELAARRCSSPALLSQYLWKGPC